MTPLSTYTQGRWSKGDLFPAPDSPELNAAFEKIKELAAEFETFRPQLKEDMDPRTLLDIIQRLEAIDRLANRIYAFAELNFAEDTQDQPAQVLMSRVEQAVAELSNRTLFFSLWWKGLSDESAQRLLDQCTDYRYWLDEIAHFKSSVLDEPEGAGGLRRVYASLTEGFSYRSDYRYWLEEMRHFKPYTLSEPEEKVINIKDVTGASALRNIYDSITNRYTFDLEVEGKVRKMTRGELMVYARHHDADLRARAYRELYRVYGDDGPILGQFYQALVRDWGNEKVALRTFRSPIAARNLSNDIPDDVVDLLLDVCSRNAPVFQRFFHLKARWLGMERLRRYDIYAPVAGSDKRYDFQQACEMTMDSFSQFDPLLAGLAKRVFAGQHADSEVRHGKRSGAFCLTALPELTPWVLLNYQGRAEDVATMAHELGHAVHSMLASHHSIFTAHACLPLAETASTFGEMLLVDRLLAQEDDESVRRDLLFRQVDDSYATIMRQAYFALFERQAHEMVTKNASADELSQAYVENLRRQFGDSVEVSDEFRWEWVSIPHIYHTPFYVYAYAFGQLLVLALYQQYRREGDDFKPRYLKILASGGSQAPVSLLADAGIDVRKESFWQGGFDGISELASQLEQLKSVG